MNKCLLFIMTMLLILLGICLLYSKQILIPEGVYIDQSRNTDGSLTFTVRTITYGGHYAPRNAGVIWITNSQDQFVKTIKIWASHYRNTLVRWNASSTGNTTGAITSASLNNHQTHTVTWNARSYQNVVVPDGDYNVNVEFTEHNATTNNPGKSKVVTFNLGSAPVNTTPASDSWFNNMHLVWAPVVRNEDNISASLSPVLQQNSPNPFKSSTNIRYYVSKNAPVSLNIYNIKGQIVARLINAPQAKGWHQTYWNGCLDNGQRAVPGKYLYRLQTVGKSLTKTISLLD